MAVQVRMWINLKIEGGIRRSTHVSKSVSCYSACHITRYIAIRLHELADGHWQSLFAGLRTSLEKASSSFVFCPSVCLSTFVELGSRRTGFREKVIMGSYTEVFLLLPISVKLGHEWHALYIKSSSRLWTLVANITTITIVPKITMLAFATMATSVTKVTYIPLLQLVSRRCANISYHFLFRRGFSIVGNGRSNP